MGFVKRRASTAAKVSASNFEQWKAQYIFDVKAIIEIEDISGDLVSSGTKQAFTTYQFLAGQCQAHS